MNALAESLLGVAKGYFGPAAQQFLARELHAMGVNANTVTPDRVAELVARVRERGARALGAERADELAAALAACAGHAPRRVSGGHRLASDAAAKLLAAGKLRQAEKAYGELVRKHGDADAHVGLARTLAALEDGAAALATLRDGAAALARKGDRASAVSVLAEAVALAPLDLAAHRRLAAALANQGDLPGAVEEYARYVDAALLQGDSRRALLELAYGRETLGDLPALVALVDRIDGGATAPRMKPPAEVRRPAPEPPPQLAIRRAAAAPTLTPEPVVPVAVLAAATAAPSVPFADAREAGEPVDVLARAGVVGRVARAQPQPRPMVDVDQQLALLRVSGSGDDAAAVAASRAAILTGAGDLRATDAVLDAARRLLALGKLASASDVLLDYIGHGFTDREAHRLLIEVDCGLGRRDVAKEKCSLLSQAYRLDGRAQTAEDVERLARIL